ncbi:GlxA family transcriptional regulator [Modestobacter sp. Leaf380]|uniref:GlxA family transcriptional regulator n=1 Tax=Modestobacter sp. Leaf380 TaxID=1736356 RepID=UPI0006FFE03D|nr:helix-turn-helix domain-containing protein [Modestobacter sp. Leaf380]KQS69191.1 AraC family transcriptional regulator [Modestobacter sp. Leaf380]
MSVHRVVVLALENTVAFELGLPHAFLAGARDEHEAALYDVVTATVDGGPVTTSAGYRVLPDGDLSLLGGADTVVVPGVAGGPAMRGEGLPEELTAALHGPARLVSICTGAFVLAAAGRLDGRPATTHWMHAERFAALYPRVRLDPDVLYVDDGDVLTSAGNAAGIDLLLHVVRRDHGSAVATRVARRRVVSPWRDGGQSQFVDRPVPEPTGPGTATTRAWATRRLDQPLTLDQLAGHAAMSVRTFTRRFREETGLSPSRWLTQQRVDLARHLLETTDASVDRVAEQAGFGTATSLRQHLHAAIGVAPLAYRRTFRGSVATGR